jgi:hypothetical protein
MAVAIGDDGDVIVCVWMRRMCMSLLVMGRAGSSSLLDSGRAFHIYPRRIGLILFERCLVGL